MNPLWNTLLVAGIQDGTPYLGLTDKLGVAFAEDSIATGYGAYIALVTHMPTRTCRLHANIRNAVGLCCACLQCCWLVQGCPYDGF